MFRFYKLASKVTNSVRPIKIIKDHRKIIGCHEISRPYSGNKKDDSKCPPHDPCAPRADKTADCKVPDPCKPPAIDPCDKKPPGVQQTEKTVPSEPNDLLSGAPQQLEPWDPYTSEKNRKNRKIFLYGLLSLLIAVTAIYLVGPYGLDKESTKKTTKQKKKRVVIVHDEESECTDPNCADCNENDGGVQLQRTVKRPQRIAKVPSSSKDIPDRVPYLLIGGGTASFAAFRAIKSSDPTAKVLIITNETDYPYMKPPLSKEIWFTDDREAVTELRFKQWNGTERSLFYEPSEFYLDCKDLMDKPNGGVAIARGWTVKKLDTKYKKVTLEDGAVINFDKCLIATGASPRNIKIFENTKPEIKNKITLYRNIFDYKETEEICRLGKSIVVVGGGFLGSEISCAIARNNKNRNDFKLHQVFKESGNMGKVLPEYLSVWTTEKVKAEGVDVVTNVDVLNVSLLKSEDRLILTLSNGQTIKCDQVIVAAGVQANTELGGGGSGLEVDPDRGGFRVNDELMAQPNVYSAGDCACFFDDKIDDWRRAEHHDHAVVSGRLAGENMAGLGKKFLNQSMFWSDLGPDVGYEAVGVVDSTFPTVGVFAKTKETSIAAEQEIITSTKKTSSPTPTKDEEVVMKNDEFGKGVIFYLKNDIVVGIVLWNVFNRMSVARQVLKDKRKHNDLNEVAKLFRIHEE